MVTSRRDCRSPLRRHGSGNAAFALVALLFGCDAKTAPEAVVPPAELTAPCDPAQPVPAAPPRIRTADQLAKAYDATDVARARNGTALLKCSAEHTGLIEWIEGQIAR